MIRFSSFAVMFVLIAPMPRADAASLTEGLMQRMQEAWNSKDVERIAALMQPSVYFQSPFQTWQSLETLKKTVLVTNPPIIKALRTREQHHFVGPAVAWSSGEMDFSERHPETGEVTGHTASYVYVFTPASGGDWKLEMMLFVKEWENDAALNDQSSPP